MPELNPQSKDLITDFKEKARQFWAVWNGLNNKRDVVARQSPEIKAKYNKLMNDGVGIRSKIEWVTAAIDKAANLYGDVKSWIMDKFGFDGISDSQLAGMGILPLIPVAIIAAAVAAISYWTNDAYQFNAKLNEIQRLENKGISPVQAAKMVEQTFNTGIFSNLKNLILPLVIGGGIIFLATRG